MSDALIDVCIEILRLSNDGDNLSQCHLKLVELGVNGRLTAKGEAALRDLLAALSLDADLQTIL